MCFALFQYGTQAQTLVHYWNFNNTSSFNDHIAVSSSLVSGAKLDTLRFVGGTSLIDYSNGTGQGFDINNFNARNSDPSGNHLRFNNPIYGALIYSLPSTGFKDLVVKYASMRSGSGAYYQFIYYTTDGSNYTLFDTIEPTTSPVLYTLDFSGISGVNDNANFKVKIEFGQGGGGTAGNNRMDNLTLEGNSLTGLDTYPPTIAFNPTDLSINELVNIQPSLTFNEDIRLINNNNIGVADSLIVFKLNSMTGADVPFSASYSNKVLSIVPSNQLLNNQTYYLALKSNRIEDLSDNAILDTPSITFTTIALQTQFNAGDIVPIAYRMNASGADDEVALLTFVNILPGTIINFTDAKYTDNSQAQCAGGLTWTAPQSGVAAGTVIQIKNDVPEVNIGSLTGSGFGLSSGGDQFMVYTGKPEQAKHITALSSNNWLMNNTACSGSNSKLPSNLMDGTSSINLSTANGNVSGNTANAYYHGPQNLPISQLKDSILNPANWTGTASGTNPQTWPNWAFDGPPVITSAKIISNTKIELVFNKDLDNASATNLSNFTGIANLQSVNRTNNGNLKDTLILTYSTAFVSNASYSLSIDNVKDNQLLSMFTAYQFSFVYTTEVSFTESFAVVKEDIGTYVLKLNVNNPANASVKIQVKPAAFNTADASDYNLGGVQTLNITGTTTSLNVNIGITNDNAAEQDEYFVIELTDANGVNITGSTYMTLYIQDNDKKAPVANKEIELNHIGSFKPDANGSTCEIVAYDSISKRLFMTSAVEDRLDIADFSQPGNITLIKSIDMSTYGGITSVAIKNGIVAVASPNANEQLNGKLVFFNSNGDFLKEVTVGALPDNVVFSPDGKKVLTANEGQPSVDYSVDPEGSVSVVDISNGINNLSQSNVTTQFFTSFNSQETTLISSGVRKTQKNGTLSQDLEPEYIAVSGDSKKAWVTLQENNAIAEIDLANNSVNSIWALGTKDWSAAGNGFDASDRIDEILIASWPVKSFFIPDAIAAFQKNGTNYIVSANEGDEKEYDGLNERTTVGSSSYVLDSAKYPNAAMLKNNDALGRFRVTNLNGDTDNDGDFDQIYSLGSRSFSIFNADNKSIVFDSKDDFEQIISKDTQFQKIFNADNEDNELKGRSRAKGPEPEGVCLATINKNMYAFVGLERVGGVMVYNITDPQAPEFVDYNNTRSLDEFAGDNAPEGIIYISDKQSPDQKHYILVANEISGTVAVFNLKINTQNSSIEKSEIENELRVYPNPNSGSVLQINQTISGVVLDVLGNEVLSIDNSNTINIEELKSGVYFIRTNQGAIVTFVVSHS
jgi:hypothetical protein